jgi:hypothetical protein
MGASEPTTVEPHEKPKFAQLWCFDKWFFTVKIVVEAG